MSELKYSASMVSKPFWFLEFQKTIKLLNSGLTLKDIQNKNINENIYGAQKQYRAKEIYNFVSRRAKVFDNTLIKIFCETDTATQKAMALYAVMKTDRLFFEFMYEVYREKVLFGIPVIEDSDIMIFLKNKQCQDETAAKWADCTLKKLRNSYTNCLLESGLLRDTCEKLEIMIPILDSRFEQYLLLNKAEHYLYAMTGAK